MVFYVYILKCKNGRYYVGQTNNLSRRLRQHTVGDGCKYTTDFILDELIYYEIFSDRTQAVQREKQRKGWSRAKKEALILNQKPRLKLLGISHQSPRYHR
ncbi:MAG: excinuclease ABC C subunit-like protein [uncultured bacterium]|nr:MAG: excinuclease ABC C subunit-like protein [uncultured bacterium]HLD44891.1 GIY-YIG nuclease family protein [bacterium]